MSRETMSTEPEAMRLADALDAQVEVGGGDLGELKDASVELRRLALKQWVGLKDDEIDDCEEEVGMPQYEISSADLYAFARAIEAKLKDKNV